MIVTYENKPEDYDYLAKELKSLGLITFSWSGDAVTSRVVYLGIGCSVIGLATFGGQMSPNSIVVGLRYIGSCDFDIKDCAHGLNQFYVAEKLNGAGDIAVLLKEICSRLMEGEAAHEI